MEEVNEVIIDIERQMKEKKKKTTRRQARGPYLQYLATNSAIPKRSKCHWNKQHKNLTNDDSSSVTMVQPEIAAPDQQPSFMESQFVSGMEFEIPPIPPEQQMETDDQNDDTLDAYSSNNSFVSTVSSGLNLN